jgi:hypothetical protein
VGCVCAFVALALALVACGGRPRLRRKSAMKWKRRPKQSSKRRQLWKKPRLWCGHGRQMTLGSGRTRPATPTNWCPLRTQSDQYQVVIESFPQESNNDSVAAASAAGIKLSTSTADGAQLRLVGHVQPLPRPRTTLPRRPVDAKSAANTAKSTLSVNSTWPCSSTRAAPWAVQYPHSDAYDGP